MSRIVLEELKVLSTGLAVVNNILLQHTQQAVHYPSHWTLTLEEGGGERGEGGGGGEGEGGRGWEGERGYGGRKREGGIKYSR